VATQDRPTQNQRPDPAGGIPIIVLDRVTPVPLWYQIVRQLTEAIEANLLTDGHRLPGPTKLAVFWCVSQTTANRAVQELLARGLLIQHRRGEIIIKARDIDPTRPRLETRI
jgi:DNA-binding GntR family transcriptional regulator